MKALNKYFLIALLFLGTVGMVQAQSQTAPWTEDFESHPAAFVPTAISTNGWYSPSPPSVPEWNIDNFGGTGSSNTGPAGAFSGTTFALVETSGSGSHLAELISPVVDVTALTTPGLSFYYHMYGADMGTLSVDAWDGSTWVNVWSLSGQQQSSSNDPWALAIVDISSYIVNNTVQVRFTGNDLSSGFTGDMSIDDVTFSELVTCLPVTNLTAANTVADTIQVSYAGSTSTPASSYIIEYGPAGFALGTGTALSTTNTSESFGGLGGCQTWDFYVTPICTPGDTGITTGPVSASYVGALTAPFLEVFGGGSTPVCWSQNQASTSNQWKFTGTTSYNTYNSSQAPNSVVADGSHFAWLDFSYTTTNRILTMPEIDISGLSTAALSFWYYSYASYNTASANNFLHVEASDGAGNWNLVTVIQQDAVDWQFKLYDLSTYAYGPNNEFVQIRFRGEPEIGGGTAFYNDILIDNIKIDVFPTAACSPIMAPDTTDFEDGGALNACWEQSVDDNLDWTINTGPTGSGGTGPSGANSGSYYAYLESSSPVATGDSAILISPPINTANLADAPAVYFSYHMFGNDSMILRLEYEIFGSNSWTTVWEQTGAVQTAETDPYEEAYVPIPSAIGSLMRLRFTAVAGTNNGATPGVGFAWQSDMAIDDIRVQNVLADDVAVTNIITPNNDCGLGVTPVTIEVTNRGFNSQTNVPIFVAVNGSNPVGAAIPGPIPGNGGTATVDVLVDMTALGHYVVDAHTALANDEVPSNDAMMATAYHQPQVVGEYSEEFEGADGYWYAEGDWEHGTPAGSVITSAGAGSDAFVTSLTGNYSDAKTSYLYSPCFNLSGMTNPFLRFSIFWDVEDDWDGAWLEYSTGGAAWTKLGTNNLSGQNWYTDSISNNPYGWVWNGTGANGSGGWVDAIIDLSTYGVTATQDTRFRFVMASDGSVNNEGLGIDNFGIFDGCLDAILNETVVEESTPGTSDGSITLNPVGGFGGYTFAWSDGSTSNSISGLAPGTYDVTVTDQFNCATIASYTIGTLCPADLGLSTIANPTFGDGTSGGAATISATGGTAPYTFNWDNGVTDDYAGGLAAGDYTVVVTDANGCTDTAVVTIETQYLLSTDNLDGLTALNIAPNPAKDFAQLNIAFENAVELTVRIADVTGRVLETRHAGNTTAEEMRFDVSNLTEGVYFMQIIADGQTATKRFIVIK